MNSIIFGLNDDTTPRRTFLPKNSKLEKPFKIFKPEAESLAFEWSYDVGMNGKAIVVGQTSDISSENYVSGDSIEKSFTFYLYYDGGISKMFTRKFKSKLYVDHVISSDYNFAITAIMNTDGITLSGHVLDCQKYSKITTGRFTRNLHAISTENKIIVQISLKLSFDNKFLCLVVSGFDLNHFHNNFCEAHFFKCFLSSEDRIILEQFIVEDITKYFADITDVSFNSRGNKLLLISEQGYLIYSLLTKNMIAYQDRYIYPLYWTEDIIHGERLISLDMLKDSIFVYSINYDNKRLNKSAQIRVSPIIGMINREDYHQVSIKFFSGKSLILLSFQYQHTYILNPFNGQILQAMKFDGLDNCLVCEMKSNWPSDEIIVFYLKKKDTEFYGNVFHVDNHCVESLLFLSAKEVLKTYPVNYLNKLNLPKAVAKFLCG